MGICEHVNLSPVRLISNAAEIREMGRVALETVVSYYESLAAGRPVVRPTTS